VRIEVVDPHEERLCKGIEVAEDGVVCLACRALFVVEGFPRTDTHRVVVVLEPAIETGDPVENHR
jgi:hypothetical protein